MFLLPDGVPCIFCPLRTKCVHVFFFKGSLVVSTNQKVIDYHSPLNEEESSGETYFRINVDSEFLQALKSSFEHAKGVLNCNPLPADCQVECPLLV